MPRSVCRGSMYGLVDTYTLFREKYTRRRKSKHDSKGGGDLRCFPSCCKRVPLRKFSRFSLLSIKLLHLSLSRSFSRYFLPAEASSKIISLCYRHPIRALSWSTGNICGGKRTGTSPRQRATQTPGGTFYRDL